jgi:hypothetical protein
MRAWNGQRLSLNSYLLVVGTGFGLVFALMRSAP